MLQTLLLYNIFRLNGVTVIRSGSNLLLVTTPNTFYIMALHLRYSTLMYNCSFISLFGIDILNDNYLVYYRFIQSLQIQLHIMVLSGGSMHSIQGIFCTATWYERECGELLPIRFIGLTDTRQLLLPYNHCGTYPLKKH